MHMQAQHTAHIYTAHADTHKHSTCKYIDMHNPCTGCRRSHPSALAVTFSSLAAIKDSMAFFNFCTSTSESSITASPTLGSSTSWVG